MQPTFLQRTGRVALVVFLLAFAVRLLLFATVLGDLRHGSAPVYGSAAIGLVSGEGLTYHTSEMEDISDAPDNRTGDFMTLYRREGREHLVEFLPGPAALLGFLWKVIPVHNFAPLVLLQVLIDSLLIAMLFAVLSRVGNVLALLTALAMTINIATIKRTLMMGYDFWPQFGVLAAFVGVLWLLSKDKGAGWYLFVGCLAAVPYWFRNITLLLPFFLLACLVFLLKSHGLTWRTIARRSAVFVVPVLVCLALVSAYRYETTGSARPTRSTFWHSFFAGVGQFSNPYGIDHTDRSVWRFGIRLNDEFAGFDMGNMMAQGQRPDSLYEQTLKDQAKVFLTEHPDLFARNWVYRIGIMISPLLYTQGDLVPARLSEILRPLAFLMVPLWFLGMFALYRRDKAVFWLSATVYAHFFAVFGWFYVVGRVILPFMFVSILVYLAGLSFLLATVLRRRPSAT